MRLNMLCVIGLILIAIPILASETWETENKTLAVTFTQEPQAKDYAVLNENNIFTGTLNEFLGSVFINNLTVNNLSVKNVTSYNVTGSINASGSITAADFCILTPDKCLSQSFTQCSDLGSCNLVTDAELEALIDSLDFVNKTGDNMSGNLDIKANLSAYNATFQAIILKNNNSITYDAIRPRTDFKAYFSSCKTLAQVTGSPYNIIGFSNPYPDEGYTKISFLDHDYYEIFEECNPTYAYTLVNFSLPVEVREQINSMTFKASGYWFYDDIINSIQRYVNVSMYVYNFSSKTWLNVGGHGNNTFAMYNATLNNSLYDLVNSTTGEVFLMFRNYEPSHVADQYLEVDYMGLNWSADTVITENEYINNLDVKGDITYSKSLTTANIIPKSSNNYVVGTIANYYKELNGFDANIQGSLAVGTLFAGGCAGSFCLQNDDDILMPTVIYRLLSESDSATNTGMQISFTSTGSDGADEGRASYALTVESSYRDTPPSITTNNDKFITTAVNNFFQPSGVWTYGHHLIVGDTSMAGAITTDDVHNANFTLVSHIDYVPTIFVDGVGAFSGTNNIFSHHFDGDVSLKTNSIFYLDNYWKVTTGLPAADTYINKGDSYFMYNTTSKQFQINVDGDRMLNMSNKTTVLEGNLVIAGNLSVRRPYAVFTDNTTQTITGLTTSAYVVNFSKTEDAYLINVVDRQNITVLQTGDYVFTFMPLFTTTTGSNKHIDFWIQKNGIDVPRSNTKIEIPTSNIETAISISYQIDLNTTDNVRFMWASDTTAAQILYIPAQTSPTRPETPSVILNVLKVSELT